MLAVEGAQSGNWMGGLQERHGSVDGFYFFFLLTDLGDEMIGLSCSEMDR